MSECGRSMEGKSKVQDQSQLLTCYWKNILHVETVVCSIGLEELSVRDLLLDLVRVTTRQETARQETTRQDDPARRPARRSARRPGKASNSRVSQWNRLIGDAHLLCIHIFLRVLRGGLILGHHTLWGHRVIFSQNGISRVLCTGDQCIRKELGSMKTRFEGISHRCARWVAETVLVAGSLGCVSMQKNSEKANRLELPKRKIQEKRTLPS